MTRYILSLPLVFICLSSSAQILNESFDSTTNFSTSIPFFSNGSGDYFTIDSGFNIGSFVEFFGADDRILVAQDLDGQGGPDTVTLTWSGLDITGQTGLGIEVKIGEDAAFDGRDDWDENSFVHFDYSIDAGNFMPLLWFEATGADSPAQEDSNFDGVGDGDTLTDTLTKFIASISGTGSLLDIRITIGHLDAGDEDVGIDNLVLFSDQMLAPLDTVVIINEFSPCDQWVELKNLGEDSLDIGTFWLYNANNLTAANIGFLVNGGLNSSVELAPNEIIAIASTNIGTSFGEIGLFTETAYSDPSKILDYVAYNMDQSANTAPIAVAAGVWGPVATTFIDATTGPDCNSSSIKNTMSPQDGTETDSSSWCETIPSMGLENEICIVEGCPAPNELVITEIMKDPMAVNDENGEYIEIYNAGSAMINLNGFTLSDNGTNNHVISSDVIIAAGEYAVLASDGNTMTNGGFSADYVYNNFFLGDGDDEVILSCNDLVIDSVYYDNGALFPDVTGSSMFLDPNNLTASANDNGLNWCISSTVFGDGDKGTPGMVNDACECRIISSEIDGAGCSGEDFSFSVDIIASAASDTFEVINAANEEVIGSGICPITITFPMNVADTILEIYVRDSVDNLCISSDTLMVQLTVCNPCPPSYTMANGNMLMGALNIDTTFTTPGDIESTQLIGTTNPNISVIYSTPSNVSMDTPFEVNQGVSFEVNSDGCPE